MLSVRKLTTRENVDGLSDVSLEVQPGEVVVVIGPNGSGKSRLLRTIADPDSRFDGEIIVHHFHSRTEPEKVKLQIGYASLDSKPEPYLTGFEYLELIGAFYHLAPKLRIERILELGRQFNCLDQLYGLIERQSQATIQKIRLIASLIHQSPLLVWDEPLLFLDPTSQEKVLVELKKEVARGAAVLVATNDLSLAQKIADQIVVLDHGQITTIGSVAQLQNQVGEQKKDLSAVFKNLVAH